MKLIEKMSEKYAPFVYESDWGARGRNIDKRKAYEAGFRAAREMAVKIKEEEIVAEFGIFYPEEADRYRNIGEEEV